MRNDLKEFDELLKKNNLFPGQMDSPIPDIEEKKDNKEEEVEVKETEFKKENVNEVEDSAPQEEGRDIMFNVEDLNYEKFIRLFRIISSRVKQIDHKTAMVLSVSSEIRKEVDIIIKETQNYKEIYNRWKSRGGLQTSTDFFEMVSKLRNTLDNVKSKTLSIRDLSMNAQSNIDDIDRAAKEQV